MTPSSCSPSSVGHCHTVSECNKQIQSYNYDSLIVFFKKKHRLTSKFLKIAHNILRNKSLNFGVFHYFGDKNFVQFLEHVLEFVFIIVPILDVGSLSYTGFPIREDYSFRYSDTD